MYARRTAFHILIALALVLGFGAAALPTGSVSAAVNIPLGDGYALALGADGISTDRYLGSGAWSSNGHTMEFYLNPSAAPLNLGPITVDQIDNVVYRTKDGTAGGVDWGFYIYTVGTKYGWYEERLVSEPMYSNGYDGAPADTWNTWEANGSVNQPVFYDSHYSAMGFYGGPTLATIKAGAIDWSAYGYTSTNIDYGAQQVKYFKFGTGSAWSGSFFGLLDAIELTIDGEVYTIDLEELLTTTYVDDDWTGTTFGVDPDGTGPAIAFGNDAFATIQQAINATAPGGTVYVAAGTYNEEMLIGKSVTILGPNAAISPNTGTRVAEAVIAPLNQAGVADPALLTTAGNISITIKGLTFDMVNTADENDRFVESINKAGITWVFEKNIFTNAPSAINGNWYITGTTAPSSFTLLDNYFYHSKDSNGISLWGDGHTIDIRDNVWKDNAAWAVNFNNVTGTFSGNQVLDTEENGPNWYDEQAGFLFASANNLVLENNLMDGLPNPYIRIYPNFSGPLTMTGNTFINSEDPLMGVIRISDGADLTQFVVEKNSFLNDPLVFQVLGTQTFNGSPNWFGSINGPAAGAIQGAVTYIPWCGEAACTTFITPTVHNVTQDTYHITIQHAIDTAVNGDVIEVGPGTYTEAILLNKPNITVRSTGGRDVTIIDVPFGSLTTGVKVLANMGTVTFDGFTVKNFTEGGIIQGMAARPGTTFHVLNNKVIPYSTYLRNGIQVSGDGSTVIGNFVEGAHLTTDWASTGILVVNANNVIVENNEVSGSINGVDTGIAILNWDVAAVNNIIIRNNIIHDADYPLDVTAASGTVTGVVIEFNQVTNYVEPLWAGTYGAGISVGPVDASPNWWGSQWGPTGPVTGPVTFGPWCAQAACTSFLPVAGVIEIPAGTPGADVQTILNNAPAGSTIKFLGSPLPNTGAFIINTPHLTIILADGTVIQNNSPCFVVNADYTTIQAATIGGAQCVPTAGSNGIDVTGTRVDLTIQGIDFVGTTGTDGIHFGTSATESITDLVLVDNWFHGFAGDGVEFFTQPLGTLDIHGNLFQANGELGIDASTFTVPAEYNSWGHYDGPAAPNGDGISAGVDADPWTHVDLYMTSSGTSWADQVVSGQTITYTVYGNLQNVNAADFTLLYPAGLTYFSSTLGGTFSSENLISPEDGSIRFLGYDSPGTETGMGLTLFTVTFTAAADSALNLDELTDGFGMAGVGSSSNVYAAALLDKTVNVINLPTLTSASLTDTYIIGTPNEFTLTINNPTTGAVFTDPELRFTLPAGSVLEYDYGAGWVTVSSPFDPGTLAASGLNVDLTFRLTLLVGPGSYPLTVELFDTLPTTDALLATTTANATVTALPAVVGTVSMQGRATRAGVPMTLTALNFTAYGPFTATSVNQISSNITFSGLASDTYRITTNQPRYLNLTAAENKTKLFSATLLTIQPLELKGGNADWSDNEIGVGDASMVGTQYGSSGTTFDGDVNFSGKVDINDLAMVGGNYGLNSTGVYGTWVP